MSAKSRFLALAFLCTLSASAGAQRYLVMVGIAGGAKASIVEFRPCVPAETSDCGAWLDRIVDTSVDSSYGKSPAIVRQSALPGGATSVAIDNGRVKITPLMGKGTGRSIDATGLHGAARALVGGDSQSVFVVADGASANEPSEVCLIDLRFGGVIARFRLDGTPAGVAMVRR